MTLTRDNAYGQALLFLAKAKSLREARVWMIEHATEAYGWTEPAVSGCEQEHWPAEIKDALRENARMIAFNTHNAAVCWRMAGKQTRTYLREAAKHRVNGCRY